jgi:hypothetical protein
VIQECWQHQQARATYGPKAVSQDYVEVVEVNVNVKARVIQSEETAGFEEEMVNDQASCLVKPRRLA